MAGAHAGKDDIDLSDEEIKSVIGGYEEYMEELGRNLVALRKEYGRLEETSYEYAVWRQTSNRWDRNGESGFEDPMLKTLLRKEEELRVCRLEVADSVEALEEKRLRIQRIHLAYRTLPPEEFAVLKGLYEDRRCWKTFPREMGAAKQKILRLRTSALNRIRAQLAEPLRGGNLVAEPEELYR